MSHSDYMHIGTPAIQAIEECAELIHAISKAERFGYDKVNPLLPEEEQIENWIAIHNEIKDALKAIEKLKYHIEDKWGLTQPTLPE